MYIYTCSLNFYIFLCWTLSYFNCFSFENISIYSYEKYQPLKRIIYIQFVKMFDTRKRSNIFNFNALGIDKTVLHGRTTVTSDQVQFILFPPSRCACQFCVLCAADINERRLVIIRHNRIELMRFKEEI